MEDLLAVLPFGGTFDLVQLRGSTLRKIFEFSVRRYGSGTGEFLQVSGTCSLSSTSSFCYSQIHLHHLHTLRLANRWLHPQHPENTLYRVNLLKNIPKDLHVAWRSLGSKNMLDAESVAG